ncbi:hypothetical protein OsJ_11532 [Oryza sativa Japonica Group]|uniref:Uncharacterized protein n=3 Tax=Oryza TaxID=4527 RepID=A3AJU3_ORYSJ|nr:hypothetical protein [Oryza sativa Japonica Group]ABF97276.1 hypothetical protein LOC_Os03g38150 [Oryza sativa Japonica Group]EAZ27582.1 hypothetical protein OsJ_11532 [Oryza sativa Japonica Group]
MALERPWKRRRRRRRGGGASAPPVKEARSEMGIGMRRGETRDRGFHVWIRVTIRLVDGVQIALVAAKLGALRYLVFERRVIGAFWSQPTGETQASATAGRQGRPVMAWDTVISVSHALLDEEDGGGGSDLWPPHHDGVSTEA